ncbi:2-deoxyglucose-6-phosphate phosphatase [Entamoeba marina]
MKVAIFDYDGTIKRQLSGTVKRLASEYLENNSILYEHFNEETLTNYFNQKTEEQVIKTEPIDGIVNYFNKLNTTNIPIIIASSGKKRINYNYLNQWNLQVNDIVTTEDVIHGKPEIDKSLLIGNNYNDCTANIQTLIDLFEKWFTSFKDIHLNMYKIIMKDCLHLHSKNSTINFLVNNTISIDFRNFLLQYFDITENDLHQYAMKINQEQNQINIQTIISKINQISNDELITFLQINKGSKNEKLICELAQK